MINRIIYILKSGKIIKTVLTASLLLIFGSLTLLLQTVSDQYNGSVRIKKHIGDYALFSVNDISGRNDILDSRNSASKMLNTPADSRINSMNSSFDTYSDTQWYINNLGYYITYSKNSKRKIASALGIDMDVTKAWDNMKSTESAKREVVVAIIDTGVDYTHPDLSKNIWVNPGEIAGDNIDNDNNGYIDDVYGWDFYNNDASICHYDNNGQVKKVSSEDNDNHGTHIAGIIAAVADNNLGIAGIASNVDIKIMTLKINGGNDASGYMSSAVEAVKYATMMGADICNLSWGTDQNSDEFYEVMKESDMLFVAAAGNSGGDNDKKPLYPANYELDNLISVTSIDSQGKLSNYSDYGANTVDIAAPGNDIYSTVIGGYASMSGTSMAAPQVTAVAALLYSLNDHLYPSNVKDIIMNNLKPMPELEGKIKYPGIPDAYQAIEASKNLLQDTGSPMISVYTIYNKGEMTVPVVVGDSGASKIRTIKWIYGNKKVEDFKHGTEGTEVKDNKVNLANAGVYTFYASDYAGNETAISYQVTADKKAPDLKATLAAANNDKLTTVTVTAKDLQSGLKRVKYMQGIKKAKDFLPAGSGKSITLKDGKGTFSVAKDGIYTIFASDYRGNMTVKVIIVKTIKATDMNVSGNRKTGPIGGKYYLKPHIKPVGSVKTSSGYRTVNLVKLKAYG